QRAEARWLFFSPFPPSLLSSFPPPKSHVSLPGFPLFRYTNYSLSRYLSADELIGNTLMIGVVKCPYRPPVCRARMDCVEKSGERE
ncbi:hypothetical protein GGR50DRAFT_674791, partial [Xylaria sp. CBS 124048]